MKTKFLILPILAGVQLALANGGHNEETKEGDVKVISTAVAGSNAEATSSSSSESSSAACTDGSCRSDSASTSSSNSGGNEQNQTTVYRGVRSAPGVFAGSVHPTAKCQGGWQVGGSVPGGGLSFGKSRTIRDCMLDELATAELARGNLQASIQLRCRISYYVEALGDDCAALLNSQDGKGEATSSNLSRQPLEDYVSEAELNEKLTRMYKALQGK